MTDRYLSVDQVAELLGTSARFPRRLIEERRIRYVKVGRHVRIPESAVAEFISSRTVEPIRRARPRVPYRRAA
ncbi:excisionase family DNA-binding protein [Streptomyces sp. bgisy027]|uniref:excisionase family DNA-binding protein n=1 Tax=Streptomyces sp. bgisy027 TaxID=3413770 RepID=UPI003D763CAC